ncbi:hypothetical protein [Algoriphagus terrigena]|uniref:hypothetical protein n=1 Tax=Algoriphagus terrigena TaxID=344884 RepID=UPI00047D750F|nr:hypothetical protein [Algoriphagus terrigena]
MIKEETFTDFVTKTFKFLQTEFQYELSKREVNGNVFYDVEYTDNKSKIISISLETIENYVRVIIFTLDKGKRSDYDDNSKTFHLRNLTDKHLKTLDKAEFENNHRHFKDFETKDKTEKMILKSAKDLRLCLKNIND